MKFNLSFVSVFFALMSFTTHAATDVTRGQIDSQGGSSATMTINVGGVHQLSGNYSGEIVINASNVTFDLRGFTVNGATRGIRVVGSNVTVQNGIIRGAGIGVRLEGSNNFLIGLDLVSNGTGVEIVSNGNTVHNCNAYSNTSAGFSLISASRNRLYNCTALDNGSTGNAYGFIAQDGVANTFEECTAERTQTSGASPLLAAGFLLTGTEQKSKVLNCQANNTSGSVAAGMWAKDVTVVGCTPSLSLLPSATFNAVNWVLGVSWLNVGSSYYVASAGGAITVPDVRVLQFNPGAGILSSLPSATFGSANNTYLIDWLTINGTYYLAAADFASDSVRVLQFDPSRGVLFQVATFSIADPVSCSWLKINSSYYLAVGNFAFATVLLFNPAAQSLTQVVFYDTVGYVNGVNWQQIGSSYYLAIAGFSAPRLRVLNFNPATSSLTPVATLDTGENVYGSSWLQTGTNYYIATGFNTVRVVQFDPGANTLTQRASNNSSSWQAYQNDWLAIGSSNYLVCGSGNTSNNVNVFNFNPSLGALSVVAQYSYTIGTSPYVYQPAWQTIRGSKYIAFGGGNSVVSNPALVGILNFDDCLRYPLDNMIMNNQSSGNVTGFQDDAGYFMIDSTNQWVANFGANNTANFNIGSQYPISSAKGTGVGTAENIDASLTTGGPAEQIMATIVDQAAPTIAQVNTFVQCQPTYITGATTLTSGSYYALGRAVDGQITLNGVSNVSLNLMGRRVRNILVQNCSRITILNGYISGTGVTNALDINGSTNVRLEDLFVTGATYGLRGQNQAGNITANNCFFNSNTSAGVQIDSGRGNSFTLCMANKNGTDGFVLTGTGHTATYCMANRNAAGAGFKVAANSIRNEIRSCSACANATGYDFAITTSNIAINNFAYGNTTNYVANIRYGVTTATQAGNVNYTANIQP